MRRVLIAVALLASTVAIAQYVNNGQGATQVGGRDNQGQPHTVNTDMLGNVQVVVPPNTPMPVTLGGNSGSSIPVTGLDGGAVVITGSVTTGQPVIGARLFGSPTIYPINPSADPRFIASGDFNRDGWQDIVIAGSGEGKIEIWLNDKTGHFTFSNSYSADSIGLRGVAVSDFDSDGKLDIATANTGSGFINIFMGNGDGTFKPTVTYPSGIAGPYQVKPIYIATQTILSLVLTSLSANGVAVVPGIGDGGFLPATVYPGFDGGPGVVGFFTSTGPATPYDINGDGLEDIFAGDATTDGVWFDRWIGLPDGGFGPALGARIPGIPLLPQGANGHVHYAIPWDCNNDNIMDVVAPISKGVIVAPGTVLVSPNATNVGLLNPDGMTFGDMTFRRWADPDKTEMFGTALGDFNGDGNMDVAIMGNDSSNLFNGVFVFLGDGNCHLSAPIFLPIDSGNGPPQGGGGGGVPQAQFGLAMIAADFNNDGIPDLATATEFSLPDALFVWLSNAPTTVSISTPVTVNVATQPVPIPLRSMNLPNILTFGGSVVQALTGLQPLSCWNILCNYPTEYNTTWVVDAGYNLTPNNGLEVPAHGALRGDFGWEKDVCLNAPYTLEGDYTAETIIQLVSTADGGMCKVAQHKTYQQN